MTVLKTAAVIPARYDSSRFPGKALVDILGKAMIVRVYQAVEKCEQIDEVYVATDDKRIKMEILYAFGFSALKQHHRQRICIIPNNIIEISKETN